MKTLLYILFLAFVSSAQSPLTFSSIVKDGLDNVTGLKGITSIAVSPDNKNVYASGMGDSVVAAFSRDAATGALSFGACYAYHTGGLGLQSGSFAITVSPDNKNVYVGSFSDSSIVVFERDAATGALKFSARIQSGRDGVRGIAGATSIIVTPDNRNVYVTGLMENALAVFDRDVATGALTYDTCFIDDQGDVKGLSGANEANVSPDNKNVYVTAIANGALAVFNRDPSGGVLSFSTAFESGGSGLLPAAPSVAGGPEDRLAYMTSSADHASAVSKPVGSADAPIADSVVYLECMNRANSAAVSQDNKSVYVTGLNSLMVFNRDVSTGALNFSTCFLEEQDSMHGIGSARSVAVSPDNRYVYVAGGSYLGVFTRDVSTGALAIDTFFQDGENGVDGLNMAREVMVSPDNKNVYVAGQSDNAIAIFSIVPVALRHVICTASLKTGKIGVLRSGRLYTISFTTKTPGTTVVSLFDARGRLVKKIANAFTNEGEHAINADFTAVRDGIYFVYLTDAMERQAIKIVIAGKR